MKKPRKYYPRAPRKKCSCGRSFSSLHREICQYCHRKSVVWANKRQQEQNQSYNNPVFSARGVLHLTDAEVMLHLKDFVRGFTDMGECSPVKVYSREEIKAYERSRYGLARI